MLCNTFCVAKYENLRIIGRARYRKFHITPERPLSCSLLFRSAVFTSSSGGVIIDSSAICTSEWSRCPVSLITDTTSCIFWVIHYSQGSILNGGILFLLYIFCQHDFRCWTKYYEVNKVYNISMIKACSHISRIVNHSSFQLHFSTSSFVWRTGSRNIIGSCMLGTRVITPNSLESHWAHHSTHRPALYNIMVSFDCKY